ncbi:MAG TPA: monovalent cation/H(+) antiporter subunit G [Flavobacterium sp.]|nr:monovalent cation/H(+) antiporter subunit G [Flavobacterium sp.]
MSDFLIILFTTLGAIFILIAALGIYRMPDFYTRLSVTVKASTLGVGCILAAVAVHFSEFSITTKVLAVIFFLFITSPVAAFLIARSAYVSGIHLWDKSVRDELEQAMDERQEAINLEQKKAKTKKPIDTETDTTKE